MARQIIHVDMDEFFAAVEKLDRPELRGKPLLIGGDAGARGVVSTASYEARAFGCHSAMPMGKAIRLCPQAIVLPVRYARYRQVSDQVFAVFDRFTPLVEPLSIDEAFLDITGSQQLLGPPEQIAATIKRAVREDTGLVASVGLAPNKFLAKLASDLQKPDGLTIITEENLHQVLDPLPITRLWGVGPATAKQFERFNLRTIGQIRQASLEFLREWLGESAEHFHRLANGLDDRPVTPDGQAKSIGQEQTFAVDLSDMDELRRVLSEQVQEVARRLRSHGLQGRTVTLKLRYGDFTTITRSSTLAEATNLTEELRGAAHALLDAWARRHAQPLRLLGMTASQLSQEQRQQLSLFPDPSQARQQSLDRTLDDIARRFGSDAVRRGLPPK